MLKSDTLRTLVIDNRSPGLAQLSPGARPKLAGFQGFCHAENRGAGCERKSERGSKMIYSPSRTEAYDMCSLKGKLMYQDGWEPREANNGTVGRIVGAAFAKGSEEVHKGTGNGVCVAGDLFDRTVNHYVLHGVTFSTNMNTVKEELCKVLGKYGKDNPFQKWTQVQAEVTLKEYGNCRLDVVGIDNEGYVSIADCKYKRTLNTDYLNKTVNEYRDSWQFQHYPWAYNNWVDHVVGEPYHPATRMYLVLITASPYRVLSYPFTVKPALQKRWAASAQQAWADIAAIESGNRQPRMATVHRSNFGDCPMKRACFDLDLDEGLMNFEYTKVPRLPEETV